MLTGLMVGVLWGLDTVILGIALSMAPFITVEQAVPLAPLVSTFLHDAASSVWMLIYTGLKGQYRAALNALKTPGGKFVVLGAALGGPVGMSGYVASIHYIGPAYTAIISAMFPALGALLAYIFLRERMTRIQILGLTMSIAGVAVLGYTQGGTSKNAALGLVCVLLCCVGWASEAVVCAYGLRSAAITAEQALQIRQLTSALFYGAVILPVIRGWKFAASVFFYPAVGYVFLAALCGTASYVCYYKTIGNFGATRAMALNITYSAWSTVFALLFLHTLPDMKSILCGIAIVIGSVVAAAKPKENVYSGRKR